MTSIDIRRPHQLPLTEARFKVERIAMHIATRFEMSYDWRGDTLGFRRLGVNGHIVLLATEIRITVRLGFYLLALKASIEREIDETLSRQFASERPAPSHRRRKASDGRKKGAD